MMRTCDICGGLAGMPFNPPECRVYTSRDLGVTVFPLGCLSMRRVRNSVDATPEGGACAARETGSEREKPSLSRGPSGSTALPAPIGLITDGRMDRDDQ